MKSSLDLLFDFFLRKMIEEVKEMKELVMKMLVKDEVFFHQVDKVIGKDVAVVVIAWKMD